MDVERDESRSPILIFGGTKSPEPHHEPASQLLPGLGVPQVGGHPTGGRRSLVRLPPGPRSRHRSSPERTYSPPREKSRSRYARDRSRSPIGARRSRRRSRSPSRRRRAERYPRSRSRRSMEHSRKSRSFRSRSRLRCRGHCSCEQTRGQRRSGSRCCYRSDQPHSSERHYSRPRNSRSQSSERRSSQRRGSQRRGSQRHGSQRRSSQRRSSQRRSSQRRSECRDNQAHDSSHQKGGCCGSTSKSTIVGGWAWAWWLVTDVQRISLEVMTLNPMCEYVETAQGVPLTVTGVAQCKIMNEDELLTTACEQFLGKTVKEIKTTVLQTLEGHLRAILGTLTVEEVYKDRDQFAGLVREVAAPDVGRMGIEILSFTIKDVYDDVQYLASLGKAQTAVVKRDADVGVAQANRDAGIREAECEKSAMDVKYSMDTRIEDNTRLFKLQKAQFDQEVNTAKAEAALAYELQAAKIKQKIRNEEIQIEVVERRKQIEVEQQEILRRQEELLATVRLPAEAEAFRLQIIAEGKRTQTVEAAKADAERIKVLGLAEATAIGDVGKADAERMLAKAKVYKQYGEAAIMALVLESLPKIAAEVSAPLAKTDEIVLVGDSGATGEVARLASGIPPALKTLTGLDLSQVLKRLHPQNDPAVTAASSKKVAAC